MLLSIPSPLYCSPVFVFKVVNLPEMPKSDIVNLLDTSKLLCRRAGFFVFANVYDRSVVQGGVRDLGHLSYVDIY